MLTLGMLLSFVFHSHDTFGSHHQHISHHCADTSHGFLNSSRGSREGGQHCPHPKQQISSSQRSVLWEQRYHAPG